VLHGKSLALNTNSRSLGQLTTPLARLGSHARAAAVAHFKSSTVWRPCDNLVGTVMEEEVSSDICKRAVFLVLSPGSIHSRDDFSCLLEFVMAMRMSRLDAVPPVTV